MFGDKMFDIIFAHNIYDGCSVITILQSLGII